MTDHAPIGDDISGLWGPGKPGGLEPAALRDAGDGPTDAPAPADDRVPALQREVERLERRVEAWRVVDPLALRGEVVEVGRRQEDAEGVIESRLAEIEATVGDRVRELAQRMAQLAEAAGAIDGLQARLDDLARQVDALAAAPPAAPPASTPATPPPDPAGAAPPVNGDRPVEGLGAPIV